MPVYKGSRYERSVSGRVLDSDGVVKPVLFRSPVGLSGGYGTYQVLRGDRLDKLSYVFYGTENLWWLIADANPGILLADPLVPGTILRVPGGTSVG